MENNIKELVVWEPTMYLRQKTRLRFGLDSNSTLQQLWKGSNGEQQWRDIPEHVE